MPPAKQPRGAANATSNDDSRPQNPPLPPPSKKTGGGGGTGGGGTNRGRRPAAGANGTKEPKDQVNGTVGHGSKAANAKGAKDAAHGADATATNGVSAVLCCCRRGAVAGLEWSADETHLATSQIPWSKVDTEILHNYRRAYRLDCPSAYKNPCAESILESGIGRNSPTMARPRNKRRVHKDQLAKTVRKHFKSLPVNENEVIVDLLYKVKTKGEFLLRPSCSFLLLLWRRMKH